MLCLYMIPAAISHCSRTISILTQVCVEAKIWKIEALEENKREWKSIPDKSTLWFRIFVIVVLNWTAIKLHSNIEKWLLSPILNWVHTRTHRHTHTYTKARSMIPKAESQPAGFSLQLWKIELKWCTKGIKILFCSGGLCF